MSTQSNLPMHTFEQHRYWRFRGWKLGADGELLIHVCVGLPCCGIDVEVEIPPDMPILEFCQGMGFLFEAGEKWRELPTFQACKVKKLAA